MILLGKCLVLVGVRGLARMAYFFPGARGRGGPSRGNFVFFCFRRFFLVRETSVPDIKAQHNFPTAIISRRSGEIFRRSLFSDEKGKFSEGHYFQTKGEIFRRSLFSDEIA